MSIAEFILQGGNLALLAVTLGGFYRLVLRAIPLVRDLTKTLGNIDTRLAVVEAAVGRLEGRGVCPVLVARDTPETPRPTEPDVLE